MSETTAPWKPAARKACQQPHSGRSTPSLAFLSSRRQRLLQQRSLARTRSVPRWASSRTKSGATIFAMISRRRFLALSSATLASAALPQPALGQSTTPVGVQLYTVRNEDLTDIASLLERIQRIGYRSVETYWNLYSHPAAELRRITTDAGLTVPSGHFDYDKLDDHLDYARELGLEYIVCPMLPQAMWNSAASFTAAAQKFNKWGERARSLGMKFAFHNHDYEFRPLSSSEPADRRDRSHPTTGFGILMRETDPALVFFEMDCYWVTQAGHDPAELLRRHGSRIRLLHLKDRKPAPPSFDMEAPSEHFTEIGTGAIDWSDILSTARTFNIEHLFVEQDKTEGDAIESLRVSYRNLQRILRNPR